MANVKNFGLVGVGSDLQLGKAGTRLVNNAGTFNFKAANGSTDAALTAAGITSSAGNVTLTTGNLVLSGEAATVGIAGATLSKQGTGVLKFDGTGAFVAPVGNTAARPTAATGMVRVNNDAPAASTMEYYNGTTWTTLATGGATGTLQTEIDNIEAALGAAIDSSGNFVPGGFTGSAAGATSFTDAIQQVADAAAGKDTLDELFPSTTAGNVIYSNGSNLWVQAAPGATSGVQAYDAGLAALAAKTTTGILVQTGDDTFESRTLVAPAAGITISNADGVAGNPTFALANDLAAVEGLATFGLATRTADGVWVTRALQGTAGRIVVNNGDGVSTAPQVDLDTVTNSNTGTFLKLNTDTYGRVTGTTAVVAADITTLVDGTYVNVAGDSMTGNLDFGTTSKVTGLAAPTAGGDATNKSYVDSLVSGLSWKQAVHVLADTDVDVATGGLLTIDGHTVIAGDRVLLVAQTTDTEDGIWVAAAGAWTRATDNDVYTELNGAAVFVQQGTVYADTGWTQTATLTSYAGQVWSQFSGAGSYSAGTGLLLTGTVFSVNLGAGITQLPTDEVGIDVASGKAVQLTGTATGDQLTFVLDGGNVTSGLEQSAAGLKISANGVTNAMIVNDFLTIDGDTGSFASSLGTMIDFTGDVAQGVSTTVTQPSNTQVAITVADATTSTKGVSSFAAASFTVTTGAVTLNTVDVAHGGTGATSFTATQILVGNGTSPVQSYADFTFNDTTNVLTLGGANGGTIAAAGTDLVITSTATNSDIVLVPNGTGSVVIGPVGAGLIQSDTGTALTVRGNTTLTLTSVTGDTTMALPSGTGSKVTISGPSATDYATGLAAEDLVNKQYVDTAIASGASAGAIKSFQATVDLDTDGTTNIGTAMPAGATVLSVKVNVTALNSTATLSVGKSGSVAEYMTTGENDAQATGLYMAECFVTEASSTQLIATVAAATAGTSSCVVIVTYQVAQ